MYWQDITNWLVGFTRLGLHTSSSSFSFSLSLSLSLSLPSLLPTLSSPSKAEGPKGQFDVQKIRIVEAMDLNMFGKEYSHAFQVSSINTIFTVLCSCIPNSLTHMLLITL